MISIPRDTGRAPLYIGGTFRPKFNEFLGYAGRHPELFPEGGVQALMNEVGYILGIDVQFYAATNLDGFPTLVDLVGGVTVTNQNRFWNDSEGWMEPGTYHLDGAEALIYCRSRHGPGNNDWERARRQQQVVKALAQRMASPEMIPRLPELMDLMAKLARTNAKPSQLSALLPILVGAANVDAEHIVLQPSEYAVRLPPSETGGLYMTQLRMSRVAELSRRLFGEYSRYWKA
jgi:LCP family protein required for cell wall assembly